MHKGNSRKVLVIGLDGETFRVIKPLLAQGKLPNINRLIDKGVHGILMSTIPPVTAPAWSTFMTGKNPGRHGVFSFMRYEYANGRAVPYDSDTGYPVNGAAIRSKTIWEIISEAGKQIISINIPMTYPPRKVNGLMISCFFTPPKARDYTFPEGLINELGDYEIDVDFGDGFGQFGRLDIESFDAEKVVPSFLSVLEKREETALRLMQSHPWDLFAVCFTETDRLHHLLWKYVDPAGPDYSDVLSARIREKHDFFYQRLDNAIGRLVDSAGEDVVTVILSDHGFRETPKKFCLLNQWLYGEGYLKVEGEKGDRIDWNSSNAWAEPLLVSTVGIRINTNSLITRYGVSEKIDYEVFRARIIQSLMKVKDTETGERIIREAQRREELYKGNYAVTAPDIIVRLNPAYDFPLVMTSGIKGNSLTIPIGKRLTCGTHEAEGIYIFSGYPVAGHTGLFTPFSIEDIAPTLLYLLGLPVPDDMDGRVLSDVMNKEFFETNPVRYQPAGTQEFQAMQPHGWGTDEDAEGIKQRLRNMGYM